MEVSSARAPQAGAAGPATSRIYLDNAATTPVRPEAAEAALAAMTDTYGNPSSRHSLGLQAVRAVAAAREAVARLIGADPGEIVFTSGATEANNTAISGTPFRRSGAAPRGALASAVEHPSVLEPLNHAVQVGAMPWVRRIPVDADGVVDLTALDHLLSPDVGLVCVMAVNNEVGAIQPVAEVVRRVRQLAPEALVHCDLVQAAGKLPVDVHQWGVDTAALSGHKLHAPKGVGALYVRRGVRLDPLLWGGGQEGGRRSGTENVPGIVAFGVACRLAHDEYAALATRLAAWRDRLAAVMTAAYPRAHRVGPSSPERQAPHILAVAFEGLRAEVLANHLDEAGVLVSVGSACSSHKARISPVLEAMGLPAAWAQSTLRFSLGALTREEDVQAAEARVAQVLHDLAPFAAHR